MRSSMCAVAYRRPGICKFSSTKERVNVARGPFAALGHTAPALPTPYKPYSHRFGPISCYIGVIMFLCTSRLPSFAPQVRGMRGSRDQNAAGTRQSVHFALRVSEWKCHRERRTACPCRPWTWT